MVENSTQGGTALETDPSSINGAQIPQISPDEDLMEQILTANALEQSGDLTQAMQIYQQVLRLDPDGTHGMMAQKALESLQQEIPVTEAGEEEEEILTASPDDLDSIIQAPQSATPERPLPSTAPAPTVGGLRGWWRDLSLRSKQTVLLTSATVIPITLLTTINLIIASNEVNQRFRQSLQQIESAFAEEYIQGLGESSQPQAEALAQLIQNEGINLSDPAAVDSNRVQLRTILFEAFAGFDAANPALTKNFRLITDQQGTTVVQFIQRYSEALTTYPPLPAETPNTQFQPVSQPAGTELGDLQIIEDVLASGQPLQGTILLPGDALERLALSAQAQIPLRESDEVYGQGLVGLAVVPVRFQGNVVGTVVVGGLLNRNHALTDTFQQIYRVPVVSIFAEDVLVGTTAPYQDSETRAIGSRAPTEVVEQVQQGQSVFATEQLGGTDYTLLYSPITDYQSQVVGMRAVGESQAALRAQILNQILINGAVGGALLVLAVIVSASVAEAFSRPIRELALFARRVASGKGGVRLEAGQGKDDLSILSLEMNKMASSIEGNLEAVRQQEALRGKEAEQQRQEKEELQQGVINLLLEIEGAQKGDLTVHAPMTEGAVGSIADAFNKTISNLRQLVLQVREVASQVDDLTERSARSVQQLSSTALAQSGEVTEALRSVDAMAQSIQNVAQSAQEAAIIAQQAALDAQEGDRMIEWTVSRMDKIRGAVADTAFKVERLTKSSQEIAKIATVISGISEKTNLLAFNASVEAMRAGEHGTGFRVVADEVRRLAQQVTDATKSIEQLVSTIQMESTEVQQAMTEGTAEVNAGTQLVGQVQITLRELAQVSQQIDQYLQTISTSTTGQTDMAQQVNQTMDQVVTTAQGTSESAQGVSATLQRLTTEMKTLLESMSRFRLE